MSMNLKVKCHHCQSKIGELCKPSCEVNGKYIEHLKTLLNILDIEMIEYKSTWPK